MFYCSVHKYFRYTFKCCSIKVTITVSNDYGEDVVTSDVTIENVNDPPVLMPQVSPLSLTIEENRQVNDVLVTIPVADPDVDSDSIAETLEAKLTGTLEKFIQNF